MRGIGAFILLLVVALLLRSTALSALAARGIVVDILVFVCVIWALRNGESSGATFGFVLGLLADVDAAHWLGRHALALSLVGYVVGRLSHTLVRESMRTQIALLVLATLFHQLWAAAFELGGWGSVPYLLQRLALATVVTAPLGALLLAGLRRISGRGLFTDASIEPGPTA